MRGDRTKILVPLRSHEAANEMALANRGLAVSIAGDMGLKYEPDDAVSRAWLGLYRAAQLYDPDSGYAFSTYACNWIRQWLGRDAANDTLIHVPAHARLAARKASASAAARPLTPDSPAASAAALPPVTGDAGDGFVLRSVADRNPGPPELAGRSEDASALRRALATLPVRERAVLALRYGYGWDVVAIARRLGMTRRWVASVDRESTTKLRTLLRPETNQPGGATCSCSAGIEMSRF